ncbi:MAG: hypothetical protein ACRBG0_14240 [Lewinella sp.]|jgi:hypothetical protein|uniref:hypothetical protein n=1 Tax=Lewinella sp. TaxID=2004506 RepID=UPI003D6A03BA
MDIDNILDDTGNPGSELIITDAIRSFLAESARWGKFIAIIGFVFIGLGVLMMLFGGGAMIAGGMAGMGGIMILVYVIALGISLIPIYYLYNFATKMQVALRDDNQVFLRDAFENHKSMFKFYGILMAIMLGFYALMFLIGIIGGLASF